MGQQFLNFLLSLKKESVMFLVQAPGYPVPQDYYQDVVLG